MEYLFIYLLQLSNVFENLCFILFIVAVIVSCVIGISVISNVSGGWDIEGWHKSGIKVVLFVWLLAIILAMFPTKQTLLLCGGTYLGKKVVTTEKMAKVSTIIDLELDKRIKKLKGE